MDIVHLIKNAAADQKTLVATTNTEVVAAVTDRGRTIAVVASALTYFNVGAAATVDSFAVPANVIVYINVPAREALNAFSAGTPTVNTHEVKMSS